MKTFCLIVTVRNVDGWQAFNVEAESAEEAVARFKAEGGEFSHQELEITDLAEPHLEDVVEVDATPDPRELGLALEPVDRESPGVVSRAEMFLASALVHLVEALDAQNSHAQDVDVAAAQTAIQQEDAQHVLEVCRRAALLPVPRNPTRVFETLGMEVESDGQ